MKFHKGSKNEGGDENLFSQAESVVAFIVSLDTLQCALKQPQHVKVLKTAISPPFWLHPSPLTNVLGSQSATVLLNGPFLLLSLKAQAVVEVGLPPHIMGLNCIWPLWRTMAEGLSFFWHSQHLEERLLYIVFSLWSSSNSQPEWQSDLSVNMCYVHKSIHKGIVCPLICTEITIYKSKKMHN